MITDIFDHPVITRNDARLIERQWQLLIDRPTRENAYEFDYSFDRRGNVRVIIDVPKGPSAPSRRRLDALRRDLEGSRRVGTLLKAARRAGIDRGDMHLIMVTWLAQTPQHANYRNLGEAFLTKGLGIRLVQGELGLFENEAIEPILTPAATAAWALRHMQARNFEQFLTATVPPALLLFASFTPVARAGALAYMSWNALIGFADYLYTVYSADSDGVITDQEETEAFWALLGVFPFRIVELITSGRALILLGKAFIDAAFAAIDELAERIDFLLEARAEGWDHGVAFEVGKSVFIPNYALADIRLPGQQ